MGRRCTDRRGRRRRRPARDPAHHLPRNRRRPIPSRQPGQRPLIRCGGPAVTASTGCNASSTPSAALLRAGARMADPGRGAAHRRTDHVLSLVVHHIAADHWSAGVLFADVLTAYRARRAGEVRVVGAAACAVRGLRGVAGAVARRRRSESPCARSATTGPASWPGCRRTPGCDPTSRARRCPAVTANRSTSASTRPPAPSSSSSCRELGVTEFMLLQAAVAVVLHKAGERGRHPARHAGRRAHAKPNSTS